MGKGELMITPPSAMDFSAILFDFDGILVDTEWAIYQAWKRTFEAHGQRLPLEVYTRCIGTDFNTWSPKTHLEDLSGMAFDWHDLDARRQQEILRNLEHEKPMRGVRDILETINSLDIPTAVVSSSSHQWVDGWLEKLALAGHFRTTVCRGDAPRIKPAPDLFLTAADRLGAAPAKCLVIEDSLNGMIAAHAAGMTAWVIPNRVTAGLDFSAAARVFRSLEEAEREFHPRIPL